MRRGVRPDPGPIRPVPRPSDEDRIWPDEPANDWTVAEPAEPAGSAGDLTAIAAGE